MTGLTERQSACLQAIRDLTLDGVPPSVEELRAHLGYASKGTIQRQLVMLRGRGLVDWTAHSARSLHIIEADISPAALERLSDGTLRRAAAVIGGILAQRSGSQPAAEVFHRIADRLPGVRGGHQTGAFHDLSR